MRQVKHLLEGKGGQIFSVEADQPVLQAIQAMADHHVGALLVMNGEELAGIVSERDYARKVILLGRSSAETPVWQIMSAPVETVSPDNTVDECMLLCTQRRIRHLPVVAQGRVVGVISIGDLVKAVIEEQAEALAHMQRYIAG